MIAVLTGYYLIPGRFQNIFLLIASHVYYMWQITKYGAVVVSCTLFSYALALLIAKSGGRKRRLLLALGIVALAGLLFVYKYLGFTLSVISGIAGRETPALALVMPLGISFYVFQTIGYLIDVSNKKTEPERNIATYALFISFFPQILSGPIGRAPELLPQYKEPRRFDYSNITEGLRRFLTGAVRKIVIADGLGLIVDTVYSAPGEVGGLSALIATFLYAVQLFFDFAGYSEMAVGCAKMLGIELRENFKAPYFAVSMSDFWRRWHISLTSWLEDYIFIPLVWSRWWDKLFHKKTIDERKPEVLANIFIVFIISGIWHGAGWNYIIWGALQGIYRIAEEISVKKKKRRKLKDMSKAQVVLARAKVFFLWSVSLVFFRTAAPGDAFAVFRSLFTADWSPAATFRRFMNAAAAGIPNAGLSHQIIFWGLLAVDMWLLYTLDKKINGSLRGKKMDSVRDPLLSVAQRKRWVIYYVFEISVVLFYIITMTAANGSASFIYFGY